MKTLLTEEIQSENYDKNHPWSIRIWKKSCQDKVCVVLGGLGTRPVYLATGEYNRFIGSSFSELAAACNNLVPDPLGRLSLLCLGRTAGQLTLAKNIQRLPPGDRFEINEDQIQGRWSDALTDSGISTVEEVAEIFIEHLKSAVTFDSTGWLPLTGGVDSRVIASTLGRIPGLRSYTRGTEKDGECRSAAIIAAKIGVSHQVYPFEPSYLATFGRRIINLTGGMVSVDHGHAIHPLAKLRKLREDVIIPGINGEYGRHFWSVGSNNKLVNTPEEIGRKLFAVETLTRKNHYKKILTDKAIKLLDVLENEYVRRYIDASKCALFQHPVAWNDEFYLRDRVRSFTAYGGVLWASRFKLELPFLDTEYIQTIRSLPPQERLNNKIQKEIIKRTNSEFLNISLYPSGLPLEPSTIHRSLRFFRRNLCRMAGRKLGRSPQNYAKWMRDEASYIEPLLKQSVHAFCGLIREDAVKVLWKEHLAGVDHHRVLCRLLTLVLFDSVFS
ncbi:hypothetical protein K8T06_08650 [bacterium]|nr:hypothetical protein [bacterium]